MKSTYTGPATVFRHDHNGRAFYTVAVMQQNMDGEKEFAYKPVQFKRGVEVSDHAKIDIVNAWEKFYKTKDGGTVFYIFVSEFTMDSGSYKEPARHSYPAAANRIEEQQELPDQFEAIDEDVPF